MTTSHRRIAIALGACAAGLAVAPATGVGAIAPFSVDVGTFVPPSLDAQGFYPRNAVVREGDTLRFLIKGSTRLPSPHAAARSRP